MNNGGITAVWQKLCFRTPKSKILIIRTRVLHINICCENRLLRQGLNLCSHMAKDNKRLSFK